MKGTGIKRIAPHQMVCAWCNGIIIPSEKFIWWHKVELDVSYNFVCKVVPTHIKCWNSIEVNQQERKIWKKLLDVINVVNHSILYIKSKILKR